MTSIGRKRRSSTRLKKNSKDFIPLVVFPQTENSNVGSGARILSSKDAILIETPSGPNPSPHILRNKFILHGYMVHSTALEALTDNFILYRISNETANIYSGLLLIVPAIYTYAASFSSDLLHPTYGTALKRIAMVMMFNTVCVVLYHSLISVPKLYSLVSAIDFLAIALLQLAIVIAAYSIPGVSVWGNHFRNSLISSLSNETQQSRSDIGLLFGAISPKLSLITHLSIVFLGAVVVFLTRIYIDRELPKLFVVLNVAWYFVLIPDLLQASPESTDLMAMLSILLLGGTLYLTKFPEKFVQSRFDFVFHSHFLWHMSYTIAFSLFCKHVVEKARIS
jgi:hypothetical protein